MVDNAIAHIMRNYCAVWLALLILLGLSAGSAYLALGTFNLVASLTIAAIKAGLVAMIFMRLRGGHALFRAAAGLGLFTAILLFALSSADFLVTKIHRAPWESPERVEVNGSN